MKTIYITPKSIRTILGLSMSHIYNLLNDSEDPIPHYKFGVTYKIVAAEFEEWRARHYKMMKK